jgi:hypothetical protein
MIDTLGAFLAEVKAGQNLQSMRLTGQSLRNYVTAAALCFSLLTGKMPQYYDPVTLAQKRIYLHPYLHENISQRAIWSKPQQLKEPFTYKMLRDHACMLRRHMKRLPDTFLGLDYVVWDWLRLGTFTGSRVSEYAQSKLAKLQRFQTIPTSIDAGQWAGLPLAFTAADFTFYDTAQLLVPHAQIFKAHKLKRLAMVHIRFKFDKSANNFTIRKFQATDDPILNPVDAAVSILRRAKIMKVPINEPLGTYQKRGDTTFGFLRDYHITPILRNMCVRAYPDKNHYLRVHILRLVPHSNRVTAAVCLKMGGASDEDIAFRLRWNILAVPTYLRECFQEVGTIMKRTLQGAFKTE